MTKKSGELARSISEHERRLQALERSQRLADSAFPETVRVLDSRGRVRLTVGTQADGTFAVTAAGGLRPPTPASPTLTATPRGLLVVWSGLTAAAAGEEPLPAGPGEPEWGSFEDVPLPTYGQEAYEDPRYASPDGVPPVVDPDEYLDETGVPVVGTGTWEDALDPETWEETWEEPPTDPDPDGDGVFGDPEGRWPSDLSHITIHLVADPDETSGGEFSPTPENQYGTFIGADAGASLTITGIDAETLHWVRLVAVTASGQTSDPSIPVSIVTEQDALEAAEDAMTRALEAMDRAIDGTNLASTLNRVFRQPEKPTVEPATEANPEPRQFVDGDVWFDTDDSDRMYVWSSAAGDFVDVTDTLLSALDAQIAAVQADAQAAAAAAAAAHQYAETKTKTYWQPTKPDAGAKGDTWFDTDDGNRIRVHDGTDYVEPGLLSAAAAEAAYGPAALLVGTWTAPDEVSIDGGHLAADTVRATAIAADAIGAKHTLTGPTIQTEATAQRGVKLTSAGLYAYDSAAGSPTLGQATFALDAATGAIVMKGTLTAGSQITGALLTGAGVQTNQAASRGVKINDAGLSAYNSSGQATFTVDAATGAVVMVGGLQSGGQVSGATITGGLLQTYDNGLNGSTGTRRGVKITTAGLAAYNSAGVATFFLDANTGAITLNGNVATALDIFGATITGGQLQTSANYNEGVKITSGGIVGYGGGTPKFTLSAVTGEVSMVGNINSGSTITGADIIGSYVSTTNVKSSGYGFIMNGTQLLGYNGGPPGSSNGGLTLTASGDADFYGYVEIWDGLTIYGGLTGQWASLSGALNMNSYAINGVGSLNNGGSTISMHGSLNPTGSVTPTGNMVAGGDVKGANVFVSGVPAADVNTANVRMNPTTGKLMITSSSRRFKENIADLDIDVEKIISLRPRVFTSTHADYYGTEGYGFIAEEAEELDLLPWVEYDGNGQVFSFGYSNWGVALQLVARQHHTRLAAAEAETATLRAEVATLCDQVATLAAAA